MTTSPDPPPPAWDSSGGSSIEFNTAQSDALSYGYDSTNMAFKDSSGTANYLYVGKSATSGQVAWFLRPTSNSGNCPKGKIPQLTFTVIQKGTLDVQKMTIAYNSHQYLLDLRMDSNAVRIAYPNQVV